VAIKLLLSRGVRMAFRMLQDKSENITLRRKPESGYDFSDSSVNYSGESEITVEAIFTNEERKGGAIRRTVMLMRSQVDEIRAYDELIIEGIVWNLGPVISDDGFIVVVDAYRENDG